MVYAGSTGAYAPPLIAAREYAVQIDIAQIVERCMLILEPLGLDGPEGSKMQAFGLMSGAHWIKRTSGCITRS